MAILPIPCSIKLHTKINPFPSTPRSVSNIHQPHTIPIISSTLKTSYESKNLHELINDSLPTSSSSWGGQLSKDLGMKTKRNDETLEREVEVVMCRLRGVVEMLMEVEIQKINGRLKGTCDEDKLLVENMSREIVDKILKRPVEYFKASSKGDLETRLNDLNLLIRLIEKPCNGCPR